MEGSIIVRALLVVVAGTVALGAAAVEYAAQLKALKLSSPRK